MPARRKFWIAALEVLRQRPRLLRSETFLLSFFIAAVIFLFFPEVVFARVVINEFSSNSDPEWVELYNNSDTSVDLNGWFLKDEAQPAKFLTTIIPARGYYVFENSNGWLNNSGGDTITLYDNASPSAQVDQVIYGKSGSEVGTPDPDKSAGRIPDGSSIWQNQLTWTKGTPNSSSPTSTPQPTPTPISTPTDTPTSSTKATYKINEAKDENGDILSAVKIYVDDVYIHHYPPETLEFCDGCKCDNDVDCDFGEHKIKLEKSGYQDWIQVITINAGDSYEKNPIMKKIMPTSTPTPTFSPSLTPTVISTPTLTLTSTPTLTSSPSGEILGIEKEASQMIASSPSVSKEASTAPKLSPPFWSKILIGLGISLMVGASYPFWLPKLKNIV